MRIPATSKRFTSEPQLLVSGSIPSGNDAPQQWPKVTTKKWSGLIIPEPHSSRL
jgi:hypothetical protein